MKQPDVVSKDIKTEHVKENFWTIPIGISLFYLVVLSRKLPEKAMLLWEMKNRERGSTLSL